MKKLLLLLSISVAILSCNKVKVSEYVATSTQVHENAPEVNVLKNSIGDIEWTYVSEGVYHGNLEDGFPINKTFLVMNNGVDGFISWDLRYKSENVVELRTFAGFNEFGSPNPSNGCGEISFEIRVYN